MSKKVTTAIAAGAMLFGVVIGASGEAAPAAPTTVTKTVTTEVVPQSCLDAIKASERIGGELGKYADAAAKYPPLVGRAYTAGVDSDLVGAQAVLDAMKSSNATVVRVTGTIAVLVDDFNQAKVACRNAGD